jgi:rare lipoprotein A
MWLLAGSSSLVLAAAVVTLATSTVRAYAPLSHPAATVSNAASASSATPAIQAPQGSASDRRTDKLLGIASWYGALFNGRHTASGQRFNMYAMTACHPTLPFGSMVRVTNLGNRKSVTVRITDRGDLVDEGRIIDLSYAAAQKLEMVKDGLAPVRLEVISTGLSHHSN